jgi:hypothetical protein
MQDPARLIKFNPLSNSTVFVHQYNVLHVTVASASPSHETTNPGKNCFGHDASQNQLF